MTSPILTLPTLVTKARALPPTPSRRRLDVRAKGLATPLAAWLRRFAEDELRQATRDPRGYVGGRESARKARTGSLDELRRLLLLYGLREAADSAGRVAGREIIPESLIRDAIAGKDVRIKWFWEVQGTAVRRADDILEATKTAARERVRRILADAENEETKPGAAEVARRISNAFLGPGEAARQRQVVASEGERDFAFSPERAAIIARTEMNQAENAGIFAGYEATGVEEIEWLAYKDGRSGDRHHERMHGERVRLGEYFVLPSGARLRYPGDPMGPVGELVNCRCTSRAARVGKKPPKPQTRPIARIENHPGDAHVSRIHALAANRGREVGDEIRSENVIATDPAKLSREDRAVLEAITVYSAGNVGAVRDPSRFDPAKASAPIPGPRFRFGDRDEVYRVEPTREAYENAGRVFRALALRPSRETATMYRGMHLAESAARALVPGATVDTGSIASWSTSRPIAEDFTWDGAKRGEKGVLMRMVPRYGSHIGPLSRYADEEEFISSGKVRVVRVEETEEYLLVDVEHLGAVEKREAPELDDEARAAVLAAFGRRQVRKR